MNVVIFKIKLSVFATLDNFKQPKSAMHIRNCRNTYFIMKAFRPRLY